MSNQIMRDCKACRKPTLHVEPSTSHILHLLLSILTFGVWIIFWVFIAASNGSRARCTVCGGNIHTAGTGITAGTGNTEEFLAFTLIALGVVGSLIYYYMI